MTDTTPDTIFDTPQKRRCRDCGYLVEGNNHEWICDDRRKDIHDIPDGECSANRFGKTEKENDVTDHGFPGIGAAGPSGVKTGASVNITSEYIYNTGRIFFYRVAGICIAPGDPVRFTAPGTDKEPLVVTFVNGKSGMTIDDVLKDCLRNGYTRVTPVKYEFVTKPLDVKRHRNELTTYSYCNSFDIYANAEIDGKCVTIKNQGSNFGALKYKDAVWTIEDFEAEFMRFEEHPGTDIKQYLMSNFKI